MNLTVEHPRSPNEEMDGIVSLPRMIDKTKADADGTLGDYDVDCPHDKPVLHFLGIDFKTFAAKLKELGYDDAEIATWAKPLVDKHSPQEITAFNAERRSWKPDGHSQQYFDEMKKSLGSKGEGITTWFALLDADEGRKN